MPQDYTGFAIHDSKKWSEAKKITYRARTLGPHDVEIKVDYCGICGSDVHTLSGGWDEPHLPAVVGHEIIGAVTNVGSEVTLVKVGDRVGLGAQCDACFKCKACEIGEETYCESMIDTYQAFKDGELTMGGYANYTVGNEQFVFPLPKELDNPESAPLLCAGITTFAPLNRAITKPNMKVGVVGIGGLGHLGVQFAKALGAEVYAFSRGTAKKEDCFKLGASHYVDTTVEGWSKPLKYELDFILSCANSNKGFSGDYFECLKVHGQFVSVGLPEEPFSLAAQNFLNNGSSFGSSHLGNRQEMIKMLELAAKNNVRSWVQTMPISEENIKRGLEMTHDNKARYRVTLTDYDSTFA